MKRDTITQALENWSHRPGPLYGRLADAVRDAVRQGLLSPGSRMPAERALAQSLAVSRTTVIAAYDDLRQDGWLESRHGSGTWICRRSAAIASARDLAQARVLAESPMIAFVQNDADVIDLSIGTPFPLTALREDPYRLPPDEHACLLCDRHYQPLGLPALRHAIAVRYTNLGVPTEAAQVLVTSGAQQALSMCARLFLRPGDTVAAEDPTYFGALDVFRVAEARMASLPPLAEAGSPTRIKDRLVASAPRLVYTIPSFHNPLGSTMSARAREAFAHMVASLDIPTIDDGTLQDMVIDSDPPPPLSHYSKDAPILSVGSLSKLFWGGLRVGWVRGPEHTIKALSRLKTAHDLGSSLISQAIAVRCLAMIDEAKAVRGAQLAARRDALVALLRDTLPSFRFQVPKGGVFLWVKLPSGDARELAQVAMRHGLIILPGSNLSIGDGHRDCIRLSFLLDEDALRAGVERLATAWDEYTGPVRRMAPERMDLGAPVAAMV